MTRVESSSLGVATDGGRVAFLVAGALLLGCASTFPAVVASPPLPEAHGITVLLEEGKTGMGDGDALRDGLADSLRRAGFTVIVYEQEVHGRPKPYDFALVYGWQYQYNSSPFTTLSIEIEMAARGRDGEGRPEPGPTWEGSGWSARRGAVATGSPSIDSSMPPSLEACGKEWKTGAAGMDDATVGGVAYGGKDGVGVFGPKQENEKPVTRAREATFLVNKLTACQGFVSFLRTVRASGLAADAPMQELPLAALTNLCKASVGSRGDSNITPTGSLKSLDDACKLAVAKDPALEPMVKQLHAERAENLHGYMQSELARGSGPSTDRTPSGAATGVGARPAGGSGIGPGLDAAARDAAQGIQDIERQKREAEELRRKIEHCRQERLAGRPCD